MILLVFGAVLFFFTQHRLNMEDDQTLVSEASLISHGDTDQFRRHDGRHSNDRMQDKDSPVAREDEIRESHVVYALLNRRRQVLEQVPDTSLSQAEIESAAKYAAENRIVTVDLAGTPFRVDEINAPEKLVTTTGQDVDKVLLLYNCGDDQAFLHELREIIEIGIVIGAALAIFTGYYLAARALIPIQGAWTKQQQFVADASHELRTPLSIIQLHIERMFQRPNQTIEAESESLAKMERETSKMRRLVADLLTLARADSNQLLIAKEPVQMDSLVQTITESFRDLAEIKDIHVRVETLSKATVFGDPQRIHQMLTILLDNAIKFTPPNGRIEVSLTTNGHQLKLVVVDTGIGISAKDLPHVFDRFYQSDKARSSGGTGLGLAIAKWIAEEHQGRITVQSPVADGHGTRFQVIMPLQPHA